MAALGSHATGGLSAGFFSSQWPGALPGGCALAAAAPGLRMLQHTGLAALWHKRGTLGNQALVSCAGSMGAAPVVLDWHREVLDLILIKIFMQTYTSIYYL